MKWRCVSLTHIQSSPETLSVFFQTDNNRGNATLQMEPSAAAFTVGRYYSADFVPVV